MQRLLPELSKQMLPTFYAKFLARIFTFSRQFSYQEFPKRFLLGSPTKILVKISARFMPRVFLPGNPPRYQPGSSSFSLYFIGTSCGVWTAGGNGNGGCCVFPFNYHGIKYFTCTYQDHSNPWCAISSDFDHDGVWGECIGNKAIFGSWEEAQSPTNSLRFSLYRL